MDLRAVPLPQTIGKFRIEALLGRGGMGEVYKAFDPTLQRLVALKVVRPGSESADSLERLRREAQACARLEHNNIVVVHETGEHQGVVYIAMQYLAGASLDVLLARQALTFEQKVGVIVQVLNALQHAHEVGVIHRDIKPSNVHILPDGTVKLLDFGLARVQRAETLTLGGTVMGTVHYASPEQLRGERVDHRTDIYSTGALAYEMLSGRRPFDGDSVVTIVTKVLTQTPAPLDTVWTRRFPGMQDIVQRAMSKAPEDRQQSAREMCEALTTFLAAHRDDITRSQIEFSESSQRTVVMARDLAAAGRVGEAETLLVDTLREDPDATEVRTALDESVAKRMPPPATVPGTGPRATTPTVDSPQSFAKDEAAYATSRTWAMPAAIIAAVVLSGALLLLPWARTQEPSQTAALPTGQDTTPTQPQGDTATPSSPSSTTPVRPPVTSPANNNPEPPRPVDTNANAVKKNSDPVAPPATKPEPPNPRVIAAPAAAPTAKEMFTAADPGTANTGLRYRLIQELAPGEQRDVDPDTMFRTGDRLKLAFESNVDGYFYVVAHGTSGRWNVLFPAPDINGGSNRVARQREYLIPDDGWFEMQPPAGTEEVFVIVSKEPLAELPGFKSPVRKPEMVQAAVVQDLQIRSRDLVYVKDKDKSTTAGRLTQSSYVVNRDELGKFVTAMISLRHGQ